MIPNIPTFIISATQSPQRSTSKYQSSTTPKCPPRINPIHTATRVHFTNRTQTLTTPAWRFILLSDGHVHNLLSILVEQPLPLTLLSTESLPHPPTQNLPFEEQLPDEPCIRRSITLNGPDGIPLLHASSVWNLSMYNQVMRGRENKSLYHVFSELRLEVSRAILAVHYATCDDLCHTFQVDNGSTMWARDYVFRQNAVPFLHVQEVLSPRLEKYLGEIVPPRHLRQPFLGAEHLTLGEDQMSKM